MMNLKEFGQKENFDGIMAMKETNEGMQIYMRNTNDEEPMFFTGSMLDAMLKLLTEHYGWITARLKWIGAVIRLKRALKKNPEGIIRQRVRMKLEDK